MAILYTDFATWRQRSKLLNNIKPIIFNHVELLELIYPTSDGCLNLNTEIYAGLESYNDVVTHASSRNLVMMNAFKNQGTIISNLFQIDTCFADWDGKCAGQRLATMTHALIDPAIKAQIESLEAGELI